MSVAALVLGIVALVLSFIGTGPIGIICAIVGVILGALARKNGTGNRGMATAGMVCSLVCLILAIIITVACVGCLAGTVAVGTSL